MSEQIDTALMRAVSRIDACSETPRLDAELLLAHCLEKPRSFLYAWPETVLDADCLARFETLIEARCRPTPVAYLLGQREFYGRDFYSSPAALVPRPETELLIEQALERLPSDSDCRVLDLGTGTGIIAITLKLERPRLRVRATDVDPGSLALARENAARHRVDIDFIESDWYARLPDDETFGMIVSNPPYVAAGHPFLDLGDLPAEPQHALTPGPGGTEAIEVIAAGARTRLTPGGWLILEHGYDQEAPVRELLRAAGFEEIRCHLDLNRLPRCTTAKAVEK